MPLNTPETALRPSRRSRGVSPRALTLALVAILLAGGALGAWWILGSRGDDAGGPVRFASMDPESTATVSFAGEFPAADQPALARPLGLAGDGERLYVALGEAGAIAVFGYDGSRAETITIPPAPESAVSSPIDLALLSDGRLAVIDAAVPRVVIVDPNDPDAALDPFGPQGGEGVITMPTAIAAVNGNLYVADSSDRSVREYGEDGTFGRAFEFGEPGLTFVGGLLATSETLFVADSNAERVIGVDLKAGERTFTFGRRLALPRGLASGDEGTIWVAEAFGNAVTQFDASGQTVREVIGDGVAEDLAEGGALGSPEALVWDAPTSRLYVSDVTSGRILVYNVSQEVTE